MNKRVQISIPEFVLNECDRRCQRLGATRSNYIAQALAFYAQYNDMMELMPKMSEMIDQAKSAGLMLPKNSEETEVK